MLILTILAWLIGSLLVITIVGSVIAYFTLAVPAMKNAKPLTEEDRSLCEKLVKEGKAFPFMCRQAVKRGACPCQPCTKLENRKAAETK
jgi:hypothetical protein